MDALLDDAVADLVVWGGVERRGVSETNTKKRSRFTTLPLLHTHLLVDLHADRALGHVPDDAGAAVVEFVRHALVVVWGGGCEQGQVRRTDARAIGGGSFFQTRALHRRLPPDPTLSHRPSRPGHAARRSRPRHAVWQGGEEGNTSPEPTALGRPTTACAPLAHSLPHTLSHSPNSKLTLCTAELTLMST